MRENLTDRQADRHERETDRQTETEKLTEMGEGNGRVVWGEGRCGGQQSCCFVVVFVVVVLGSIHLCL